MKQFLKPITRMTVSALVVIVVLVSGCSQTIKTTGSLSGIRVIHNIPTVSPEGKLYNFSDSLTIVYRDSVILYLVPYVYEYGITKDSSVLETRYTYFIYQDKGTYGYRYDSASDLSPKRASVDSFLRKYAFSEYPFDNLASDSLVGTTRPEGEEMRIEIYVPKTKLDFTYPDTSFFIYNARLNGIPFSFSRRLDSTHNMKLTKIRYAYNPAKVPGYNFELPKREFVFELKKVAIADQKKITDLFDRFTERMKK